jgi:hypothetical protein
MGIRKFRSVEEMPGPPPLPPLHPDNLREAFGLMRLALGLCELRRTPGVHKFRSFDALVRERARQESRTSAGVRGQKQA